MAKNKRFSGSLMGKTTTIIPREDRLDVYTTGTWLILVSVWIFAMGFFGLSIFFANTIISVVMTLIGAVLGFYLARNLYVGKLYLSCPYHKSTCLYYARPELTIIDSKQKMTTIRMLPQKFDAIIAEIELQMKYSGKYAISKRNDRYYFSSIKEKANEAE